MQLNDVLSWSQGPARTLNGVHSMSPRIHLITVGALGSVLLSASAMAQPNDVDRQFAEKAYSINEAEIELGRMAGQKGTASEVRAFGARMVTDHTNALHELQAAAREAGVPLPHTLQAPQAQLKADLENLSAKAFDDTYMKHMVAGHGGAIALFTDEIANGASGPLRSYAEKTLPMLESHENSAQADERAMRREGE